VLDQVIVPAQQIKYERRMGELLPVNAPDLMDAVQRFYVGLDETGVRVKAVTEIRAGAAMASRTTSHIFGERHPVVMWLTEPGSALPFAVIATTSQAWLDPEVKVSFDDSAFTH
jgi:hypothetical protein